MAWSPDPAPAGPADSLTTAPQPRLNRCLHADWQFRAADALLGDAALFASDTGWRAAQVPGSVHGALLAHGLIPDPFLDRNEAAVQWVGESDWCYRLVFELAVDELREQLTLCLDGLDTYATVWLDGDRLADSHNMFVPLRLALGARLAPGRHVLGLRFDSALRRGRAIEAQHGGPRPLWNGDSSRLHVRKAPYHYGWDWGPTLLTCGPWRPVRLDLADLRIAELASPVTLTDDLSHARIDLDLTLEGRAELLASVRVEHLLLDPQGQVVARSSVAPRGLQQRCSLAVPAPRLWWPAGQGGQPLYTLQTRLLAGSEAAPVVVDTLQRRLGLRRLRLVQAPVAGEAGQSFVFEVNGREIFCGGANWIPDDNLLERVTPARYHERVRQAVDAHLLMLRVWGGGIYEDEAFYDACDELGVLVWQDFVFACGLYPAYPALVDSVMAEARAAITRLRHRASLAIWCGNNEDYALAEEVGALGGAIGNTASGADPGRFEARVLYEQILPSLCLELDPGRPYWPGSPWTPATPGTGQQRPSHDHTAGDRHSWEVWHKQMLPYQRYGELSARFVSEFGLQSHPSRALLAATIEPAELFPGSRTLDWHNKASSPVGADGHRRLAVYLADNLRLASGGTLDDAVYATQFVQAEAMRHAFEAFRRGWQRAGARACGGALVWQLNDCWPVTSWAVIDSSARLKPAWYSIRRALAPITCAVRRDAQAGTAQAWAVNTRPDGAAVLLLAHWRLHHLDGVVSDSHHSRVELAGNSVTALAVPPSWCAPDPDGQPLLATLTLLAEQEGAEVASACAWPEPLRACRFPDPELRVSVEPGPQAGGATLVLEVRRPAKGVWIDAPEATLADNFLDLLPGPAHRVAVRGSLDGMRVCCLNTLQDPVVAPAGPETSR
jgi:beta-mannosidase